MIFKRTLGVALAGLLLATLLLGCGASGDSPGPGKRAQEKPLSPQAKEHFEKGWKFLQEQKLPEALKEFQETARLAPESPQAHLWVGRILVLQKDFPQAEEVIKRTLELDPKNYQAMAMLGRVYSFDKDKYDKAQEYLVKSLEYYPDYPEARFDLARLYLLKGDMKKASAEFTIFFSKEPEFATYHFEMGRISEASGDKKNAIAHYQRAHLLNPKLEVANQAAIRLEKGEEKPPAGAKPKRDQPPIKTPPVEKK